MPPRLPIRLDPAEHDEYGWFTFAEAYEKIRWTDDREALERLEDRLFGGVAAELPAISLEDSQQPNTATPQMLS
jgi:hypothetical protein